MGVLAHEHDWSATSGGYQCANCSAALSNADISSNQPNASEKGRKDGLRTSDWFSRVWHGVKGGA